jgi:chromosome partitioning protein
MIVLIGATKGGVGKTTIATNLAAIDVGKGFDSILIDSDKQGSAASWSEVRTGQELPHVPCLQKYGKGLINDLKGWAGKYVNVFVDTGGHDSEEMRSAMVVADLLLIPVRPSQLDVWELPKIIQLAQQSQIYNPKLKFCFVVNGAHTSPNVKDTDDVLELLGDDVEICKTVLHYRRAYAKAPMQGMAVTEMGKEQDPKAVDEMLSLYKEVMHG